MYKRQFLECGRPDAVLAAIRADAGFSAAEEDKVAAFGCLLYTSKLRGAANGL